jgi:hypothetical protein
MARSGVTGITEAKLLAEDEEKAKAAEVCSWKAYVSANSATSAPSASVVSFSRTLPTMRDREIVERVRDATDLLALVGSAVKLR